jgi:CheY-like chemotaxis protein
MLLRALKCDVVGVENGLQAVQEFAPHATAHWIGENVGGKVDAASAAHARKPSPSDSSGLLSPGTVAASVELVKMGHSPNGLSPPPLFEFPLPAGEAATGSASAANPVACKYDLVFIDGNMPSPSP